MPKFYLVGGAVRDRLLNLDPKDKDYVVVGFSSYSELGNYLTNEGFKIVDRYEEKYTYRAKSPKGEYCDYVWARKALSYEEGDLVSCEPGSIMDDLARRDFTINAMALDEETSELIDPFNGQKDLENEILRAVGDPKTRFLEDPRRLTRGMRFSVKLNLVLEENTSKGYWSWDVLKAFKNPKFRDKIKEELDKALYLNTLLTSDFLRMYPLFANALFSPSHHNLYLVSSSKKH